MVMLGAFLGPNILAMLHNVYAGANRMNGLSHLNTVAKVWLNMPFGGAVTTTSPVIEASVVPGSCRAILMLMPTHSEVLRLVGQGSKTVTWLGTINASAVRASGEWYIPFEGL